MTEESQHPSNRIAALTEIVAKFDSLKILCVGDVMLDRFRYGDVRRISPEAPVPVVRIEREERSLGGAGNVVRNLAALGATSSFISIVGDDRPGSEIGALLGDLKNVEGYLKVVVGRETTVKTRYFNQDGYNLLRTDQETREPLTKDELNCLKQDVSSQIERADAVILSDYGKGVLSGELAAFVIENARGAQKPIIVDPKGDDYARYANATVITPNRDELEEAIGMPARETEDIILAANTLQSRIDAKSILVTRSGDGMIFVEGQTVHNIPAMMREVADVTGAGDTVVAVLALALAVGTNSHDAAYLSNVAAGLAVTRHGTATVSTQDLSNAILHSGLAEAEQKVVDRATAETRVKDWRSNKLKVGFTNGCFDLLHPGHVALLRQAKSSCDRLIVALNSDVSVSRLKGEGRPVQNEAARAAVMASLEMVDLVVIFGEDTPISLIHALRPDVLIKGADYKRSEVVGADFVEEYGGHVVLADVIGPYSTTATIAAMAATQRKEK